MASIEVGSFSFICFVVRLRSVSTHSFTVHKGLERVFILVDSCGSYASDVGGIACGWHVGKIIHGYRDTYLLAR